MSLYLLLDHTGEQLEKQANPLKWGQGLWGLGKGLFSKAIPAVPPSLPRAATPMIPQAMRFAGSPSVPAGLGRRALTQTAQALKPTRGAAKLFGGIGVVGGGVQAGRIWGNMEGDYRYLQNAENTANMASAMTLQQMRDMPWYQRAAGAFMSDQSFIDQVKKRRPEVARYLEGQTGEDIRSLMTKGQISPAEAYRKFGDPRQDGQAPDLSLHPLSRSLFGIQQMANRFGIGGRS